MRKILLAILLCFVLSGYTQSGNQAGFSDSVVPASAVPAEKIKIREYQSMTDNLNRYMNEQQQRQEREKRNAMIRIGIGLVLFVVLIVGIRRRKSIKK